MQKIAVLNGPNLNYLGKREPEIYGTETLSDIEARLRSLAGDKAELFFFQSNQEGALVDQLYQWKDAGVTALILNGAALTHTSVALRDALAGLQFLTVEVHISNIYQREEFRKTSLTAPLCKGVITGLGTKGYALALKFLLEQ